MNCIYSILNRIFKLLTTSCMAAMLLLSIGSCESNEKPEIRDWSYPLVEEYESELNTNTRTSITFRGAYPMEARTPDEMGFVYSKTRSSLKLDNIFYQEEDISKLPLKSEEMRGKLEAKAEGLDAGTTYYYCIYARFGQTRILSYISDTRTLTVESPYLRDFDWAVSENTTDHSIDVETYLETDGGAAISSIGFRYKKATDKVSMMVEIDPENLEPKNSFPKKLSYTIEGLDANTVYEIIAFATNEEGRSTENTVMEVRTKPQIAPKLEWMYPDDEYVGATWMEPMAIISDIGDKFSKIVECGFVYSTTNERPTLADADCKKVIAKVEKPGKDTQFTARIEELVPQKKYYVRAYAANKQEGENAVPQYGYSDSRELITQAMTDHWLNYVRVDNVTFNSATFSCSFYNQGTGSIANRGFVYAESSLTTEPTLENGIVVEANGITNEFSAVAEGLKPATSYAVRAYVRDGDKKTYNEYTEYFETADYSAPSFATGDMTFQNITRTSALAIYNMENYNSGTGTVLERGFVWCPLDESTTPDLKLNHPHKVVEGNDLSYQITGLKANTRYCVRVYAKYKLGDEVEHIVYSQGNHWDGTFTTAAVKEPSLEANGVTDIALHSATLNGRITNAGDDEGTITELGFCWNTTITRPGTTDATHYIKVNDGTPNIFSTTLDGLTFENRYYYWTYAKMQIDGTEYYFYSSQSWFITASPQKPQITCNANNMTLTTADITMKTTVAGECTVTERGVVWNNSYDPSLDEGRNLGHHAFTGDQTTYSLTELTPNTDYWYRAYAKCTFEGRNFVVYSDYKSFRTVAYVYAKLDLSYTSNESSITVIATITNPDNLNSDIEEVGFRYASTDVNFDDMNQEVKATLDANNQFTYTITGLQPMQGIYVYAYAKNKAGYGWVKKLTGTMGTPDKDDNPNPVKP